MPDETITPPKPATEAGPADTAPAIPDTVPPPGSGPSTVPTEETPAGPPGYELGDVIGRGGMGVVYRARDVSLSRNVAVKLLGDRFPAGGPSARRFLEEARITGQLQHPGIPAVHQAGALPDGRPFLAMKLIKGRTLANSLPASREHERPEEAAPVAHAPGSPNLIAVFEQLCQAVGYAHAHNVIHRDLKPANVMVGAFGEVQVMDWGLAKVLTNNSHAASGPSDESTLGTEIRSERDADLMTEAGMVMGTPAYMPPEQAIGAVDKIDRRSDVFGLGAILCAVLTGKPPYIGGDAESTRQLAARAKLEDAFTRLDASGAEPDLVTLAKQCLSAEPADRPADAGAVAAAVANLRTAAEERARRAELDRVRADGERAAAEVKAAEERKRRRAVVMLAGAVAAALATGGGLAFAQWQRAERALADVTTEQGKTSAQLVKTRAAEAAAQTEAANAQAAEGKEREAAALARTRAEEAKAAEAKAVAREREEKKARATAEAVAEFMQDVFAGERMEGEAGRYRDAKKRRTVMDAMGQAASTIAGRFGDRPEVEAGVRNAIGAVYTELGAFAEAQPQLERALALHEGVLGPDHPDTLAITANLAGLFHARSDIPAAEKLYRRALAGREKTLGPDHPDTLRSVSSLALTLHSKGEPRTAEPLYRRALAGREKVLGPNDPYTLKTAAGLAGALLDKGNIGAAEVLLRRAVAGFETALSSDHPNTLQALTNLGGVLNMKGDVVAAEPLLCRARAGWEKVLGPDHPHTLKCNVILADLYRKTKRPGAAVPLLETAYQRMWDTLGPDHQDVLITASHLGTLYRDIGRPADAVSVLERAYASRDRYPQAFDLAPTLLDAYQKAGRPADAVAFARDLLRELRPRLAPGSSDLGGMLASTGKVLMAADPAAAEPVLRECVDVRNKLAPKAWTTANARSLLGGALLGQRKYTAAEPHLLAGYAGLAATAAAIPPAGKVNLPDAADRLIRLYLELDRPDEVKKWRAERAKYPRETAPPPRPAE